MERQSILNMEPQQLADYVHKLEIYNEVLKENSKYFNVQNIELRARIRESNEQIEQLQLQLQQERANSNETIYRLQEKVDSLEKSVSERDQFIHQLSDQAKYFVWNRRAMENFSDNLSTEEKESDIQNPETIATDKTYYEVASTSNAAAENMYFPIETYITSRSKLSVSPTEPTQMSSSSASLLDNSILAEASECAYQYMEPEEFATPTEYWRRTVNQEHGLLKNNEKYFKSSPIDQLEKQIFGNDETSGFGTTSETEEHENLTGGEYRTEDEELGEIEYDNDTDENANDKEWNETEHEMQ